MKKYRLGDRVFFNDHTPNEDYRNTRGIITKMDSLSIVVAMDNEHPKKFGICTTSSDIEKFLIVLCPLVLEEML